MGKVAIRGLLARKLRLVLTSLSVALGVTLIVGTLVYTDTFNKAFDDLFSQGAKGTDAAVTPDKPIDTTNDGGTQPTIPASVLQQVRSSPDVASASGAVFDVGAILGNDGKRISTQAPNFIASVAEQPRFDGFVVKDGRKPRSAGEAAIDADTADREHFELGGKVCATATAARTCYTLVGTTEFAGGNSGGASFLYLTLPEAERMLGKRGFDQISVAAKDGTTPEQLKAALATELPRSVVVRTGQEQASKDASDITGDLSFLRTVLLAFAGISVFVGAFIVFNTFSITVAQRTRELGMLRTIGASRRQVLRAVIGEGLALGVLGSIVGVLLGLIVASGLRALLEGFGLNLPTTATVIKPSTIIVGLLVGTVITLLACIAPAIRATRVAPVEALRQDAAPSTARVSKRTTIAGGVLLTIGIALMVVGLVGGLATNPALVMVGAGALAAFLGVALFSPLLVRPLANLVGRPLQAVGGISGQIARENSIRLPGRTAVTAAALMIGVTLVAFASIFASSLKATVSKAVDENLKSAFVVQNSDGFSPFSPEVLQAVAKVDGVDRVSGVRFSRARIDGIGGDTAISGIDGRTFPTLYTLKPQEGGAEAIAALADGQALVGKGFAEDHGTKVGDTLAMTTPNGKRISAKVTGVVDDKGGLTSAVVLPNSTLTADFGEVKDAFGMVGVRPGADLDATKAAIDRLLTERFPAAEVLTGDEFKDSVAGQINQVLAIIYVLLALSIIVSLFGIVNTLVLSITERTRELGMLRAVGTSRRQVRRIVRYEAVITSLIGGVIGVVLGIVLAIIFTRPIDGLTLSIPVGTLILMLVVAAIAGIGAAVLPARRASKLKVLDALAYE